MLSQIVKFGLVGGAGIVLGVKYSEQLRFGYIGGKKIVFSYIDELGFREKESSSEEHASKRNHTVMSPPVLLNKAVELTKEAGALAVLSTVSNENGVSSRCIQPFEVEYDAVTKRPVIYFNTSKFTRKVSEINANPNATLTYLNPSTLTCITYIGKIERIPYPDSTKHWRDWLYAIFPEGNNENEGSRFTTWRVVPDRIQVLSYAENIHSHRGDNRPPELLYDTANSRWKIICNGYDVFSD